MGRFVKQGDKVVIKPNMSSPNPPDWGSTTHPDVVRELTAMCVEAGASSVLVLDNPLRSAELCLVRSGVRKACEDLPQTQVQGPTNKSFYEEVKIPEGKVPRARRLRLAALSWLTLSTGMTIGVMADTMPRWVTGVRAA